MSTSSTRTLLLLVSLAGTACGQNAAGDDGGDDDTGDAGVGNDAGTGDGGIVDDGALETATGCTGVYNPDQVLDLRFTMAPGDWAALKADTTNAVLFPAQFQCNDDPPLPYSVGIRRKRSGGVDKPGLKVDFNHIQPGGNFFTLKKLSLENGISEGSGIVEARDVVSEYLAWRLMRRSGAISGRAAFARVHVNGDLIGTYVDVEQVDKRFLKYHVGDNDGWLYKRSGSPDDGYKTNETLPNPYEADLCFWAQNACPTPSASELETYLPQHLDITQMLRFGGVNAIIANSDSPLGKDNNYYWYDWVGPRVYLPWDLDTTMKDNTAIFGTGGTMYTSVLFTHWEDDYDAILTTLLAGQLSLSSIQVELDRVGPVAGAALDADPYVDGTTGDAIQALSSYWSSRHPQLTAEVAAHAP